VIFFSRHAPRVINDFGSKEISGIPEMPLALFIISPERVVNSQMHKAPLYARINSVCVWCSGAQQPTDARRV
jgi:hypothetical protein